MESDDAEVLKRIKETVVDVLEEMDMLAMVRAAAAERLGLDLSVPHRKKFAQSVMDSFFESLDYDEEKTPVVVQEEDKQDQAQEREEEEEEEEQQDQAQEGEEEENEVEEKGEGDKRVLGNKEHECEDAERVERIEEEEGGKRVLGKTKYEHDDAETRKKIGVAVWVILKGADMTSMTEAKVCAAAAERLGMDFSVQHRKTFVRRVIKVFFEKKVAQEEVKEGEKENHVQEGEEEEGGDKRVLGKREYECDDSGDPMICALSSKRRVTLQEFKGKTLVSICEFYEKDGKQLPTCKGMSLTVEQWEIFRKAAPQIEDAIKQLGGSIS